MVDETSDNNPNVNDITFDSRALNFNKFQPKKIARSQVNKETEPLASTALNRDMVFEKELDPEIVSIKKMLKDDEASKKIVRKFIVVESLLYVVSDPDDEPVLRLLAPNQLKIAIVKILTDLDIS